MFKQVYWFILLLIIMVIDNCTQNSMIENPESGSSKVNLTNLIFTENLNMTPQFNSGITDYTIYAYNDLPSFKVIATAEDPHSYIKLNGQYILQNTSSALIDLDDINAGETKIIILTVISENKKHTKNYTFHIEKLSPLPKIEVSFKGFPVVNQTSNFVIGTYLTNTATTFTFSAKNKGSQTLQIMGSPLVDLTGDSAFTLQQDIYLTALHPGESDIFLIQYQPKQAGIHHCSLQIMSNDNYQTPYVFSLEGHSTNDIPSVYPRIIDNFENGKLDTTFWITDGNSIPAIQKSIKYEGNYALALTNIPYKASAVLKMIVEIDQPTTLSFYLKRYLSYNNLKFEFINNNTPIYSLTDNNSSWTEYSYQLVSGKNIITWKCTNNSSNSYYTSSDYGAWIDNIHLESGNIKVSNRDIQLVYKNQTINNHQSNINLSKIPAGYTQDEEFTIENNGGYSLLLTGNPLIEITGDDDQVFTISKTCDKIINAGSKTTFTLNFKPKTEATYHAVITIRSNDPDTPEYQIAIAGVCSNQLQNIDNFDSGNLSGFPWIIGGEVSPFVQSTIYKNGGYSLELGNVGYQQESYAAIIINVLEPSTVSFYYRVSSGYYNNILTFSVDDSVKLTSYSNEWALFNADLSAGTHKLKWKYYAGSTSSTTYKSWIDDVQFVSGSFTMPEQEININYNNKTGINNGEIYNESRKIIPDTTRDYYFYVENSGAYPLLLTGTPKVLLSGDTAFTMKKNITADSISAFNKEVFVLSFHPTAEITYQANIIIACNDTDEPIYNFSFTASGGSVFSVIDDFESGDLTGHIWGNYSAVKPYVQSTIKQEGLYSAAFGKLPAKSQQELKTIINVSSNTSLVFYYKINYTSSNRFEFLVDDVVILSDNSTEWAQYTYNITSGNHKLIWRLINDSSTNLSSDIAWIDDIKLMSGTYTYNNQTFKLSYNGLPVNKGAVLHLGNVPLNKNRLFNLQIDNYGSKKLILTGSPSHISLTGNPSFSLFHDVSDDIAPYSAGQFSLNCISSTLGIITSSVSILSNDPFSSPFTFSISVEGKNYLTVLDDFESGDLSGFNWVTGGQAAPYVQNQEYYQGSYALRFGKIGHSSTSTIQTTINVLENSVISFFYKQDTESCCDYLVFYDNGVQIMKGTNGQWKESPNYNLSAGVHTLKWVYNKDGSVSSGQDTIWLDNIQLKSGSFLPVF